MHEIILLVSTIVLSRTQYIDQICIVIYTYHFSDIAIVNKKTLQEESKSQGH